VQRRSGAGVARSRFVAGSGRRPIQNALIECGIVEATECIDPAARATIVDQILAYNQEDLDATWAVMEWLRR
jgi:predicted RecB family nuclease